MSISLLIAIASAIGSVWASLVILCCILLETFELALFFLQKNPLDRDKDLISSESYISYEPFVSLHVPICREPVIVVTATLRALACLKYEKFEVIVVYNNTSDPEYWIPIELLCNELGLRFRFFYVEKLSGFKAGALNYALAKTDPAAEIIGVIDADYIVSPTYLEKSAFFFSDPHVGFVQTPQDYKFNTRDLFAKAIYWEYWQFFEIGMVLRERASALMLHGTMCLIKRSALEAVGRWCEWCVTEDSELALRLLSSNYQARFLRQSYGFGLLPFSLADYRKQRRRWALGTVQQIKVYVFGENYHLWTKLHYKQRFFIFLGWAPWVRDAFTVVSLPIFGILVLTANDFEFSFIALIGMGAILHFTIMLLLLRQCIIYIFQLRLRDKASLFGTCAIMSLTLTVGLSMISGLFRRRVFFNITPKQKSKSYLTLRGVWFEILFGCYLLSLIIFIDQKINEEKILMYCMLLAYTYIIASGAIMKFMEIKFSR